MPKMSIFVSGTKKKSPNPDSVIERKFRRVYKEIDRLDTKIYQKSGFLFFRSHVYTIKELLNSPHHQKIYSFTEKIGDDAQNWYRAGRLSEDEQERYHQNRSKIDRSLRGINISIQKRKPTWWEVVKEPFTQFVEVILHNLPEEFHRGVIDNIKNMFVPLFKMPKFLK